MTAVTMTSGCRFTTPLMMSGWRTFPSSCCTTSTMPRTSRASVGPLVTRVTRVAAPPATVAPMIGTKPPRNVSRVSDSHSGTPTATRPMPIPAASARATSAVPRTYAVRVVQASRPPPSTRSRWSAGTQLRAHRHMVSPSLTRKKTAKTTSTTPVSPLTAVAVPETGLGSACCAASKADARSSSRRSGARPGGPSTSQSRIRSMPSVTAGPTSCTWTMTCVYSSQPTPAGTPSRTRRLRSAARARGSP